MSDLDKIVSNLTQPIDEPYVPPPKPRKSWRGLAPGRKVKLRVPWFAPDTGKLDIGTTLVVDSADSQGVWLRVLHGDLWTGDNLGMKPGGRMRFEQAEWSGTLERLPKARKRAPKEDSP